jgi:four helix bundle protein
MANDQRFNLANRTAQFTLDCRKLVRSLPKDICNVEDSKQLVRSSGSVAANYLEADEALSKKDFVMRIKVCRKESRESKLWLTTITVNEQHETERQRLQAESYALMKIFNAIVTKSA